MTQFDFCDIWPNLLILKSKHDSNSPPTGVKFTDMAFCLFLQKSTLKVVIPHVTRLGMSKYHMSNLSLCCTYAKSKARAREAGKI